MIEYVTMTTEHYDEIILLWKSIEHIGLGDDDEREGIGRFLRRNDGLCFAAMDEGRVIGAVLCGHDGRRGTLYHLAVDPAYRRRGVSSRLLELCFAALRRQGIRKCNLVSFARNRSSHAFYMKTGWTLREDLLYFDKLTD